MRDKFILEIKVAKQYRPSGYGRFAVSIIQTWQWKQIAICEEKQPLIELAQRLPVQLFFDREREFQII